MCLIIVKPPDKHITRKELSKGFLENSDGIGFMFVADRLIVKKGFTSFRDFYKGFRNCEREHPNTLFAVHFRLATHGDKHAIDMMHPFVVNDVGVMHNGILSKYCTPKNSTMSDTALFCEKVIAGLPAGWLANTAILTLLENYAKEEHSKFVFMSKEHYCIINESAGEWKDGCWFSNKQYSFGFTRAYFGKYTYDEYETEDEKEEGILLCDVCQCVVDPTEARVIEDATLCLDCQTVFKQDRWDIATL
jgi:predicted glutamine amidotransferase